MNTAKIILLLAACGIIASNSLAFAAADIEMLSVKGGCFQMGDSVKATEPNENFLHEVCVGNFQIGKYEVTRALWKSVMEENPGTFSVDDNRPVDDVTWDDTQAFIKKLNARTGKSYRLPTEAEWEFAARSGGKADKWSGTSKREILGEYCWFDDNSNGESQSVGTRKPNGLGLYDMCGNVSEWVQDKYGESWYKESPRNNPQGPADGSDHVNRGGSWWDSARSLRTTNRGWQVPDVNGTIGFRLALPAE